MAIRVLIGLVAGFLLGLALADNSSHGAAITLEIVSTVGTIFVNLIRMTVIPLLVSMIVAGVGSMTASGGLGRTGVRALLISVGLLTIAAIASVLVAEPILARIRIDQSAALTLRQATTAASPSPMVPSGTPTLATWFVDLVPQNVVKAAADGAMLPVILFAVMFGLALARVNDSKREAVLRVVEGIAEAMRSSLAALPAMVASAERAGLPPGASRIVLPLAMAVFHFGAAVAQTVGVVFLAHLFDVTLTPSQLASVVFAVVLASFAVPGIPGGSIIAMVPVLAVANLPLEGVGILLAVDTIPDMFRTAANLTGAMTLTAILPAPQD